MKRVAISGKMIVHDDFSELDMAEIIRKSGKVHKAQIDFITKGDSDGFQPNNHRPKPRF
jgi:hypothetical protein